MKKLGIVLGVCGVLIVLFYAVIHIVNDQIAEGLEEKLLNCPLPPNSEMVESVSIAGKKQGNGNGMQYFGIILIRSEMNEDELAQWYNSRVDTEKNDLIYVMRQETREIFKYGVYYGDHRFKHYSGEDDLYQVCFFRNITAGSGSSNRERILNFDLRGH